jgi:hypothetical protein
MTPAPRVLHLATGDPAGVHTAESWLHRRQVDAVVCHEALECAALMLTEDTLEPELALVGVAWLDPSEFAVLDYLRERWPRIRIVVYGRDAARLVRRDDDRMRACERTEDLAAALEQIQFSPPESAGSKVSPAPRPEPPAARPAAHDPGWIPASGYAPATFSDDEEDVELNPDLAAEWDAQVERELAAARGEPAEGEDATDEQALPAPLGRETVPPPRLDDPYGGPLPPEIDLPRPHPPVVLTREELAALLRDEPE